jgi:hypothetical protein
VTTRQARRAAWALAASRVALGVAVLAAPEKVTSLWLGETHAGTPVVRDLARSLGARDLALGLAALNTLEDPVAGPRVQVAGAMADLVDALATVLARADLPRKAVLGTVAVAGAAAAAGFSFSRKLAHA